MNDQTLKLIAERYLGSARCDDYVAWAVACLESKIDSKNIRILSSLQKPLYSSEVDEYFERALQELGWTMPERRECLYEYLRWLAQQLVARELTPLEANREINRIAAALDYPSELQLWMYFDGGMDPTQFTELSDVEWDDAVIREAESLLSVWPSVREK